ncbi:YceI family protein [Nocardia mangyaensis]|uniref:YceI family protein n=1 Tax=Nocardia mangyaensis TaxID=2213200 RepID=UPI002674D3BC|nr:YceI family protein [Nocardia mangyaensis]MDO3649935.1 YceI family protein [Nocardia mangyaensis]
MSAPAKGLSEGTWVIDPTHSTLQFSVRHLMVSKVRGRFTDFTGALVVHPDGSADADVQIKVDSVTTDNEQRDGHLRTADFFDAENHPVATFRAAGFRPLSNEFSLTGDFTIRGNTYPVTLDVEFLGSGPGMDAPVAGFSATATINRRDFGITTEIPMADGGAVVGDKITLSLEVEVGLQS